MTEPWLERTSMLLGEAALEKLKNSKVAIIGLGGVGGYCLEALVRSGIGFLILCDADVVTISNVNRQILAKSTNVGESKAILAAKRAKQISPHCQVMARNLFFHEDTAESIFSFKPDVIVDAIDSLNPKLALLTMAMDRHIPVVTAMGSALRFDPTQIGVTTIDQVTNDRLGAKIRKGLRHRGYKEQLSSLLAVYSKELPYMAGMGEPDEDDPTHTRGRVRRPLGTISTVPAVEGLTMASAVLSILLADICPQYKALLPKGYICPNTIRDDKARP